MNLRSIFFVIFNILFVSSIQCQVAPDDVIYLKSGTFLRGKIVDSVPGKSFRIALIKGKDTLEIQRNDISVITKEVAPNDPFSKYHDRNRVWIYFFMAEINAGFGQIRDDLVYNNTIKSQRSINLNVLNGFNINPYLQLGIGAGIDFWNKLVFVPVYADFRVTILQRNTTPFIFLNGGYSFGFLNSAPDGFGGVTAGAGGGVKIEISQNRILVISLGYRLQQTRQVQPNYPLMIHRDTQFIVLKMGLEF